MSKRRSFGISIGASSILVILVILTLVCFAGLSLASSSADQKLCRKLADRTEKYYEATSMAYADLCEASKKESAGANSFSKLYEINENQSLQVEAIINPSDGSSYKITVFKVVTVKEPEIDDSLSLLIN